MKKHLLLTGLILVILSNFGFAQSHTYFDFEEVTENFNSWAGATWEGVVANPSKTEVNTSDNAGLATSGTETWAGINFGLSATIDLSETQEFTMDVYSAEAGFMMMQLINGDDKSIKINSEVEYTTPGEWQTLTFTFSGGLDDTYSSITFWIDSKNTVPGKEWYIDNLEGPGFTPEEDEQADATLSSLTVDVGTLSPAFSPATAAYTLSVPAGTNMVTVTANPSNSLATVSGGGAIDVSSGSETVSIVVTAEDGTTTMTYTIAITVAPEETGPYHTYFDFETVIVDNFTAWQGATWEGVVTNPSKTGVNVSENAGLTTSGIETWAGINFGLDGTINLSEVQEFTMDVYSAEAGFMKMQLIKGGEKLNSEAEYTTPGEWQTLTFDFSGGLDDTYSSITFWIDSKSTVQGKEWYIDNLEGPELTSEEDNVSDARLSALTVDVGTLSPGFSPAETVYTLTVPEGTSMVNVTAIANNENATVSGDGEIDIASGNETIPIEVTAEDGATTITYTIMVTVVPEEAHKGAHPGHYVTLETNYTSKDLQDVLTTPGLKGVQIRYMWKTLEPSKGVYDFSKIETALALAEDAGKYLIVFPVDKSFRAGERYTPEYMWEEYTAPTGRAENGEKGYIATRWDSFVVKRMSLLMDTLAKKFDEEPWFEGVSFQETASGLTESNKIEYGYTPEKYRDALIEMLVNAKNSFTHSQVFWYMNFLEGGRTYIGDIADTIADHDILMGGPDILPDSKVLNKMAYPFYETFKDKMGLFCSVQNDSYHHKRADDPEEFWTLEEIFLWGRDNLYIDYCFWNYVTWKFEEGAYTWNDAKPVILKYADFDAPVTEPDPDQSAQAPFGENPFAIPGKIEAEDFDQGGEGVAFSSQTNTSTGVIEYRPEASVVGLEEQTDGAVTVGYTGKDEWLEYTVDVTPGTYNISIAYATGIEDLSDQRGIKIFLDGVEILDFDTALAGGDWARYVVDTIENVILPETAGGILKVQWKTAGFNLDYLTFRKQTVTAVVGTPGSVLQLKCYANPFREKVIFAFGLRKPSNVRLAVYDISGRKQYVYKNKAMGPGKQQLIWNGRDNDGLPVDEGVYFVKLNINGQVTIKKIIKN